MYGGIEHRHNSSELRQRAPLSFQELSFPQPTDFSGASTLYRSCARLSWTAPAIQRWARLPGLHAESVATVLERQTAFLQAFHSTLPSS